MYNNERVRIDIRKYSLDEMVYRYSQNKILFCNHRYGWTKGNPKEKLKETVKALARGIPSPSVYASELQTGELLILDKSEKFRILLEQLNYENLDRDIMDRYMLKDVLYSQIIIYVIDYMNPKYMHMEVGEFIEEWQPSQEQSVRNILYKEDKMEILAEFVKQIKNTRTSELLLQYYFIYFIMAAFIKSRGLHIYENIDKYQLLEKVIKQFHYLTTVEWNNLYNEFEDAYRLMHQKFVKGYRYKMHSTETRMKILCFLYLCNGFRQQVEDYGDESIFQIKIKKVLESCDMSYESIMKTADILERGRF